MAGMEGMERMGRMESRDPLAHGVLQDPLVPRGPVKAEWFTHGGEEQPVLTSQELHLCTVEGLEEPGTSIVAVELIFYVYPMTLSIFLHFSQHTSIEFMGQSTSAGVVVMTTTMYRVLCVKCPHDRFTS